EACGYHLNTRKLCTVRLSRKLMPGYPSYSLGNLCHSLGITMQNRHRAGGDAEATVTVFHMLLERDKNNFISKSLQRNSKEFFLPMYRRKTSRNCRTLPAFIISIMKKEK